MFNAKLLRHKNLSRGWWILLVVAGLLLFFTLNQAPPSLPAISPTPAAATADVSRPEETAPAAPTQPDTGYLAQYDPAANPLLNTQPNDKEEWELGIDVLVKLALVLALTYLAMLGLRWLKKGKPQTLGGGATINVLETTGLAPGRSLHLVVVGEKTLLLGATDTQISLLAELADAAVPAPEETSEFAQVIAAQTEALPDDELPPHLKSLTEPTTADAPVEYVLDWQSALAGMRAGIRRMQDSVGG